MLRDPAQHVEPNIADFYSYFKELLHADEEGGLQVDSQICDCVVEYFTTTEILEALNLLKLNKSAGAAMCSIDVFKKGAPKALIECVKLFFNKCNSDGIPESWRSALLMPLIKKGDKK